MMRNETATWNTEKAPKVSVFERTTIKSGTFPRDCSVTIGAKWTENEEDQSDEGRWEISERSTLEGGQRKYWSKTSARYAKMGFRIPSSFVVQLVHSPTDSISPRLKSSNNDHFDNDTSELRNSLRHNTGWRCHSLLGLGFHMQPGRKEHSTFLAVAQLSTRIALE